jgi:hypothetical protein
MGDGRLTVLEVGIAEGEGEATFWVCEDKSDWSSFDRNGAGRNGARHRAITVRLQPFEEILQEYGVPYYCKIDIEGNDHLCVSALTADTRPAFISAELSEHALLDQFSSLGYDRFKLVQQQSFGPPNRLLQTLKARAPRQKIASALERGNGFLRGRYFDHGWYFKRGSSGPLPFQAAGPWLTPEEIRAQLAWVRESSLAGDWWDLHATDRTALAGHG